LVDVPEYPHAGLQDVKRTTAKLLPTTDALYMSTPASLANLVTVKKISLAQKIEFWKNIMQYASDRGIDCYLFTWNLFTYGTENSGYGFTDKITDPKTKDYIRKAAKALIKTYPLLKGIGLTAGENMYKLPEADKEKFLYESYGQGINDALQADPNRTFKLIHRAHQADINVIKKAFSGLDPRCTMNFSYKYSVAQMYSSVAPKYIYESEFLDHIRNSKFFLTVRDDAWYYLRGGSDPSFARASRGPIIVDEDLADALNNDVIAGAGIDVLSVEPPSKDNPLFKAKKLHHHSAYCLGNKRGKREANGYHCK
jgi:hypothetical protein